jgi:LuxR family transcriptional regulator
MNNRASIATLLHDLDRRSPAGFAIALHITFSAPRYMFQTYPQRWLERYNAGGLLLRDPVVQWGMQNLGRTRWSDLEKLDRDHILDEARSFGLMNGAAISVFASGTRSIGGFARADREYDDEELAEMETLLIRLHEETTTLHTLSDGDRDALTRLSIRLTH